MSIKKAINNVHDKSYKDLYSNKEIFLSLVRDTLKANWAKSLTPDNLILINKSYIASDYEERESDIVYRANIDNNIFYILLEFQSTIDHRMPLRLLLYICEILREHAKNNKYTSYDRNIKIPAIIPIVIYNGKKKWDVSKSFKDIINYNELFENNLIDLKYELVDINNEFVKKELIRDNTITSAIFLLDQKVDAFEFLERVKIITLFFNTLTEKELQILKHWIKNSIEEILAQKAISILSSNKEVIEAMIASNAFILTEMQEKAEEKGKLEGKEQIALNMIKKGKSIEEIMDLTELTKEIINNLKGKSS